MKWRALFRWTVAAALLAPGAGAFALDDLSARILALESLGRAQPSAAAAQLGELRAATPPHSAPRLELLTVQGLMLAVAFQPEAAEQAAAALEAWSQETDAPLARQAGAAALLIRARGMTGNGNLQRADTMMQDAIALLPTTPVPRDLYRFVSAQARIKNESGKLEDAVRLFHEALALADQQDASWRQAEARTLLASAYYEAKQLDRAHALVTEALLLAERDQDAVAMGRAYNTTAIVLDDLGDRQGERRSFEQAIACARRAGAKIDEVGYLANLADFYLKSGEYGTALAHSERALVLARELNDASSETVALANIGLAQISLHHLELGKRFVRDAMAIDQRRGSVTGVSDMLRELGIYLEKAGDPDGAIAAYHEHRRLATTLLHDDQQKAILAMQEQYDADRRSRELALLNRESAIKAAQLRRRDLQQRMWWLVAAASALALAVVALLYRRVRQANRALSNSNELLQVQSERDPLTGLANRRHFQAAMRRLAADGRLNGTVYLVDIDHFKHINDRHGHATGDAVLVEVARRLRETLRDEDLIVRWGGEEFLVVVQSLAPAQVDALAERMLVVLEHSPVVCGAQRVPVSASIGFATFPIGPAALRVSWERAIDLVDTAMYLAKAHGRNRAYGVRLLHAKDEAGLTELTHSLESAWRDGQVALTLLQGQPQTAGAVAA
jgi:diguanylate cyclase (GGDEF)-like protein